MSRSIAKNYIHEGHSIIGSVMTMEAACTVIFNKNYDQYYRFIILSIKLTLIEVPSFHGFSWFHVFISFCKIFHFWGA